jgi:hypothetical protein
MSNYLHDITYCSNEKCSKNNSCVRYLEYLKMREDTNAGFVSMNIANEISCTIYWKT